MICEPTNRTWRDPFFGLVHRIELRTDFNHNTWHAIACSVHGHVSESLLQADQPLTCLQSASGRNWYALQGA